MANIVSVLGDTLVGNILYGSIISCRFSGTIMSPCGPVAFVGDTVQATGYVGSSIQTHVGTIVSGIPSIIAPDGQPIAVLGLSRFVAGPFTGTIVGPGCPGYITI